MDQSLPGVAKISKRIDYEQLYDYLNKNALLSNRQSGFRSLAVNDALILTKAISMASFALTQRKHLS